MAYSTNLWEKGELISALKLNNIEQGITENDRRLNNLGESVDVGIYDNNTENSADITIPTGTDGKPKNDSRLITARAVRKAIENLDYTAIDCGTSNTLTSLSQTNGKISATLEPIAIASSQIIDRADGTGNENLSDKVVKTNANGIIPSHLLPSYVDDVLVYDTYSDFPWNSPSALEQLQQLRAQWEAMINNGENPTAPTDLDPNDAHLPDGPEKGKIYIAADTGSTYRWYDDGQGNFGYALIGVANLDYNDNGSDTNNGTAAAGTSFGAADSKFVSSITQLDGQIKVIHRDFAPTITWTNGVSGTDDGKPTVNISVGGNSATAVTPGTAGTDVYGITKLSSSTNSSSEVLAATPKAVNDALTAAKSYTDTEIGNLDVSDISGFGANQTLSALSETDGKISASFQAIKIANTDVSGLGTASTKNVAASGNASTTEVVMGNDTRLTDARNAADVHTWAKNENKPSYSVSEITGAAASTNPTFTLTNATDVVTFTDGTTSVTFNLAELQALKNMIPTT